MIGNGDTTSSMKLGLVRGIGICLGTGNATELLSTNQREHPINGYK